MTQIPRLAPTDLASEASAPGGAARRGSGGALVFASAPDERAETETGTTTDTTTDATPGRQGALLFDPEPTQRMVVVRRKRRRTRKINQGERWVGRVRIALLGVIFAALILKVVGADYLTNALDRFRVAVHPVRAHLHLNFHVPDMEVVVLALVALGLIYTMPAVQSRVNRMLGLDSRHG